ncbi:LysR family transcriptional regulator [Pseudomonas sp. NY15372]|uniref:LysR family transcriptional regulator n=1 Tax=Pseudomonas sp. NY15372 TaxID=3400356 RepID=UPI003A84ADE9
MSNPHLQISWDDLRIIKAIEKGGSLVGAAATLGVNHSTVSRRLAALEALLGVALFDRRRARYVATTAGAELIVVAERMEQEVVSVTRRISSDTQGHDGDLRITTSDALLLDFLTPVIASFQRANPRIRIEVLVGNQPLNLTRGDSDIALRATLAPPENLFGRKVATIAWAVYGCNGDCADTMPDPEALWAKQWVSFSHGLSGLKAFEFVRANVSEPRIVYRSDSVAGVAAAIAAGIGIGLLPCMHGDLVPELKRLSPVQPEVYDELWVLTHPDMRKSDRVYAFLCHCAQEIARDRELIEGKKLRQ